MGYSRQYGDIVYNSFSAGLSAFCEIDFVNTDKFKFGIRPEVGCLVNSNDWEIIFVPKLPLSDNIDLAAGVGFYVLSVGPTIDLQPAFKAAPGKFIINPSVSIGDAIEGFNPFFLDCSLALEYQYTVGKKMRKGAYQVKTADKLIS